MSATCVILRHLRSCSGVLVCQMGMGGNPHSSVPPSPASGKQAKSGDDMLEGFCDKIGNELLFEFMIRNPYIVD